MTAASTTPAAKGRAKPPTDHPALHLSDADMTRRHVLMAAMFVGYAAYYLTRKSVSYVTPSLMAELGMTKATLGFVITTFSLSYGASKFVSSALSDVVSPRVMMSVGLLCTGVVNVWAAGLSSVTPFVILWCLNGFFQGWGWPPIARLMTRWYHPAERGRWWAIVSVSQNVGTAIAPLVVGYATTMAWAGPALGIGHFLGAHTHNSIGGGDDDGEGSGKHGLDAGAWRLGVAVPGAVGIAVSALLAIGLSDAPSSESRSGSGTATAGSKASAASASTSSASALESEKKRPGIVSAVLLNRPVLALCTCNALIYVIRASFSEWSLLLLTETKGMTAFAAGNLWSGFELGGIAGTMVAGWASDKLFGGLRGPVCLLYTLAIAGAAAVFWVAEGTVAIGGAVVLLGFTTFGPHALLGLFAAEISHPSAQGTTTGMLNLFAQVGGAIAGYPMSFVVQELGWLAMFIVNAMCALAMVALLSPLWNVREFSGVGKGKDA